MKTIITHTLGIALLCVIAVLATPFISTAQTSGTEPQQLTLLSTLLEMPDNGHFYQGSVQVTGVQYKDGYFVVTASTCAPQGVGPHGSRGQWVFTENGQLIGEQDICDDAGIPSLNLHDWSIASQVQFYNGAGLRFVRGADWSSSRGRGLLEYAVAGGSIPFLGRVPGPFDDNVPNVDTHITNPAVTSDGNVVAVREEGNQRQNVVYSMPGFAFRNASPYSFTPLTGFGPYIVGTQGWGNDTNLYRVATNGGLDFVETLVDGSAAAGYTFDTASTVPRLVLYVPKQNGGASLARFYTFELRGTDVVEVSAERTSEVFSDVSDTGGLPFGSTADVGVNFAISGDYALKGKCPSNAVNPLACGSYLQVWKDGDLLTEIQLPESRENPNLLGPGQSPTYPAEGIMGVAMSPSGKILAVNRYGAYLYQLGGVTPTGTQTPPIIPPTPNSVSVTDINGFLSIASSYLRVLQGVIGTGPIYSNKAFSPTTNGVVGTSFEDVYNQALQSLNGN